MKKVSTIGLDLAKNVFQAYGADASGGAHPIRTCFFLPPALNDRGDVFSPARASKRPIFLIHFRRQRSQYARSL